MLDAAGDDLARQHDVRLDDGAQHVADEAGDRHRAERHRGAATAPAQAGHGEDERGADGEPAEHVGRRRRAPQQDPDHGHAGSDRRPTSWLQHRLEVVRRVDEVDRCPVAEVVQRSGARRRWPASARPAPPSGRASAAAPAGGGGRPASARVELAARRGRSPGGLQNTAIHILNIENSVSRLTITADGEDRPLAAIGRWRRTAELGGEAGERRDAGQAQRRQQVQHGDHRRGARPCCRGGRGGSSRRRARSGRRRGTGVVLTTMWWTMAYTAPASPATVNSPSPMMM